MANPAPGRGNPAVVLASKKLAQAALDVLRNRPDIRVVTYPVEITSDAFCALIRTERADAIIAGLTAVGAPEAAASDNLRVVTRIGVGYDLIDVPALTQRGIAAMITPSANAGSVAEHALYGMLTVAKRGPELDRTVRAGGWRDKLPALPLDLMGKTALIIGFGRIGSRLARRLLAMDMTVLVSDPYVSQDAIRAAGAEPVPDLDAAIARADVVTLHVPRTRETTNIIDQRRIDLMKPTAILVNTARGGLLDEVALDRALRRGHLLGAALDVLLDEPPQKSHPLLSNPRCLLAPHVAGVTQESLVRMGREAADNVLSVLDGRPIMASVLNPEIFTK